MASFILLMFAFAGTSFAIGDGMKKGMFDIHNISKLYIYSFIGYGIIILLEILNGGYIAVLLYAAVSAAGFLLGQKLSKPLPKDDGESIPADGDTKTTTPFIVPISMSMHDDTLRYVEEESPVEEDKDDENKAGEVHDET